jgi:putative ABC transport system ATP-binding protein
VTPQGGDAPAWERPTSKINKIAASVSMIAVGGVRQISRIPTSSEVGRDVAAYNEARLALHTHFVRSGYVMLLPIWPRQSNTHNAGYNITDPLLTKWVCAKTRDVDARLICCRLQHHRPTSDEVGMRENRTRAASEPDSLTRSDSELAPPTPPRNTSIVERSSESNLPILVVNNVERIYDGSGRAVAALRGVSFEAEPGDFIALTGPSGCGKSTLLHIVGAMDHPTRGRVAIGGISLDSLNEEALARLRRRKVGFVFQFFNLLPTLTVEENVGLPLMLDGAGQSRTSRLTREILGRVGLADRAAHFPAELSGGEMQRAAVARAVITHPDLILADEPTGNLDSDNGTEVMNLLAELNRELGLTIILATHSSDAARYAKRAIRMHDGLIEESA